MNSSKAHWVRKHTLTISLCILLTLAASSLPQKSNATKARDSSDTIAMACWEHVYTIERDGALYRRDRTSGKKVQLGKKDFANTEFFFRDNLQYLYSIESDGSLYRINPQDGAWAQVGKAGDWKDTIAAVSLSSKDLFTIEKSGALYKTNLYTGEWQQIGKPEFADTKFLFAGLGIYTIESDGNLYKVDILSGKWKPIGRPGDWKGTIAMTSRDHYLYTVEDNGCLYETELATGVWTQIGSTEFGKTDFMCFMGDSLYTIEDGDLYLVNRKTGVRKALGK